MAAKTKKKEVKVAVEEQEAPDTSATENTENSSSADTATIPNTPETLPSDNSIGDTATNSGAEPATPVETITPSTDTEPDSAATGVSNAPESLVEHDQQVTTVDDSEADDLITDDDAPKDQPVKESKDGGKYEKMLPPKHSCLKAVMFWSILSFILGALIASGMFMWRGASIQSMGGPAEKTPAPTVVPTSTPEPTEAPAGGEDLSQYSIQVLNGSGIAGTAGDVATLLESAGFESVEVGNADSTDYEQTEVSLASGVDSSVYDAIEEALVDYDVAQSEELADSDYDVVIIVGSN